MKIINQDGDLLMRDYPTTNWAYGALLLLGSFIFSAGFLLSVKKSSAQLSPLIIVIILFALYFAYRKLSSPIIVSRVRPDEQIIEVTNIKFGLLKKRQTFKFAQIERFEQVMRKRDRSFLYFNSMLLVNGTYVDLESEGHPSKTVSLIPERLNKLLKNRKSRHKAEMKFKRKMKALKK